MVRPLLIGQAPGPNTHPDAPLLPIPSTSAGGRLVEFMGIGRAEYLRTFDRVNLLYRFPGQTARDDRFPMREARAAAHAMMPLLTGRRVVLVGRNVAEAFGCPLEFHEWMQWEPRRRVNFHVAVVPHPSGRNHWYNSQQNRDIARAFWTAFLSEARMKEDNKVVAFSR